MGTDGVRRRGTWGPKLRKTEGAGAVTAGREVTGFRARGRVGRSREEG